MYSVFACPLLILCACDHVRPPMGPNRPIVTLLCIVCIWCHPLSVLDEETIGDRPLDRDDVDVQQGKDVPYQHKHFLSNKQPADEEDICSKHGEQGGSGDSSESEDSREPSASLEGESKCSEENRPAPSSNISHISDNLEGKWQLNYICGIKILYQFSPLVCMHCQFCALILHHHCMYKIMVVCPSVCP